MKKILSFILSLITVFSFTACKKPNQNSSGGEQPGGSQSTETNKEEFTAKYGTWTDQAIEVKAIDKGLGTEWLKDAAREFNKNTGSKIQVKADESLNDSIASAIQSDNNASDIYFTFSAELQWVQWAVGEYIVPLDDIKEELSYKNEQYAKLGVYEDSRYIMPYVYSPTGFVYNQEYIDEIPSHGEFTKGTFPQTWQGLLDLCYSINNNWNKVTLGQKVVPLTWGASVDDMNYIFKGLWAQIDPDGFNAYWNQEYRTSISKDENKNLLVNDSVIKAIDSIAALLNPQKNNKGEYFPSNCFSDFLAHSNLQAQQKFLNGLSVFCVSGSWFETEMAEQIEDEEISFYRFAAPPIVEDGGKSTVYINAPSEYFLIASKGKNQNVPLAKAFLRFLASETGTRLFHASTGVPSSLVYKTPTESLSDFAKQVADVVANSQHAISGSDELPSISGAIGLNTSSLFQSLSINAASSEYSRSLIEDIYSVQKADWSERFKTFGK